MVITPLLQDNYHVFGFFESGIAGGLRWLTAGQK
jgi:hypothetical protein